MHQRFITAKINGNIKIDRWKSLFREFFEEFIMIVGGINQIHFHEKSFPFLVGACSAV